MEIKKAIYERKSPMSFTPQKIENEKVAAIVEAGNYAPIYGSIHFTVIENQNLFDTIKSTTIGMFQNMGGDLPKQQVHPAMTPCMVLQLPLCYLA